VFTLLEIKTEGIYTFLFIHLKETINPMPSYRNNIFGEETLQFSKQAQLYSEEWYLYVYKSL
jgi:hypothetical protein